MKNEVMYYCERCAEGVYYNLKQVEIVLKRFGIIMCRMCRRKNKNGNLNNAIYD